MLFVWRLQAAQKLLGLGFPKSSAKVNLEVICSRVEDIHLNFLSCLSHMCRSDSILWLLLIASARARGVRSAKGLAGVRDSRVSQLILGELFLVLGELRFQVPRVINQSWEALEGAHKSQRTN